MTKRSLKKWKALRDLPDETGCGFDPAVVKTFPAMRFCDIINKNKMTLDA